jgi:hypothetical protein
VAIWLDYALSPSWNTGRPDWATVDEMTLRYDLFLGDVVFRVDDKDFSARWDWVPVLDFALALRFSVQEADRVGTATLDFTESDAEIRLEAMDNQVRVSANYTPDVAQVGRGELAAAADGFMCRVVRELADAHPGLDRNPTVRAAFDDAGCGG